MAMENSTARKMDGTLMATGAWVRWETSSAMPMPAATPKMPPRLVSTAASVRNCHRMRPFLAPMAFFRPISRVRSVTDTSMMFITPMPPTSREMLAIHTSCWLVALESSCSSWACWSTSSARYLMVSFWLFSLSRSATWVPTVDMASVLWQRTATSWGSS